MERRARLAGELRAKQAEVLSLRRALASVDLCIRMFKADYRPALVAPKITFGKNPADLPKGSGYRKALEILRETGQPFTAMELAYLALERLGKGTMPTAIPKVAKPISSTLFRAQKPVSSTSLSATRPSTVR